MTCICDMLLVKPISECIFVMITATAMTAGTEGGGGGGGGRRRVAEADRLLGECLLYIIDACLVEVQELIISLINIYV